MVDLESHPLFEGLTPERRRYLLFGGDAANPVELVGALREGYAARALPGENPYPAPTAGVAGGPAWRVDAVLDRLEARARSLGLFPDTTPPRGVMVCLTPPADVALRAALPGGEAPEKLHLTLAYLGKLGEEVTPEVLSALRPLLAEIARDTPAFTASLAGVGRFDGEDGADPVVYSVEARGLGELRERVAAASGLAGAPASEKHAFNPHVTVAYVPKGTPTPPSPVGLPTHFDVRDLELWAGPSREAFPLG